MAQQDKYSIPVTEESNVLSTNIDIANSSEIISIIHKCEKEVFHGWDGSQGIYDEEILKTLERVAEKAVPLLKRDNGDNKNAIVLSGCGTSGRLAFMIARHFNLLTTQLGLQPCFHYLVAGGDIALLTSREAPEDNPFAGKKDLVEVCEGKDKVLYIGITCGLSAPYVAGQLDYCMENLQTFMPVLLGFNPLYLSRNVPIENWDKTFIQVSSRLASLGVTEQGFIINPIIGPEPITGSSRMKSGSATKILLETAFLSAVLRASKQIVEECPIKKILNAYELVQNTVYKDRENLSQIVDAAARSLSSEGRIHYFGFDSLGIVGVIDASECPPTFGAAVDDVRGFIKGGYQLLRNKEGDLEDQFLLSLEGFEEKKMGELTQNDVAIVLSRDSKVFPPESIDCDNLPCPLTTINFVVEGKMLSMRYTSLCEAYIDLKLPWCEIEELMPNQISSLCSTMLVELGCKWLCNVITTAAHILKGKVFKNFMVDLKVSNNKLYHRSIGIIQRLSGCTKEDAQMYLLRAIYNTDSVSKDVREAAISQHIAMATEQTKVVPVALILAITGCSVVEASGHLEDNPIIRSAITTCLHQQKT